MRIAGLSLASLLAAIAWIVVTLGSGAALTTLGPWYRALHKPPWQPPDWLFGPAWTLIFALAASVAVVAWNAPAASAETRTTIALAFIANSALNVLWSFLFFYLRHPDWALIEVGALWASIFFMMWAARPGAGRIALLLLPYLAWVSFASILNLAIVRLNPVTANP
jgi:translocator protein